jgi:hypothetical protein
MNCARQAHNLMPDAPSVAAFVEDVEYVLDVRRPANWVVVLSFPIERSSIPRDPTRMSFQHFDLGIHDGTYSTPSLGGRY